MDVAHRFLVSENKIVRLMQSKNILQMSKNIVQLAEKQELLL